jgi:hypothetical protein
VHDRAVPLKLGSLSLNLPFGLGGVTIEVTEAEARAAWALYVEYATRISGAESERGLGSPREALNSLYSLFATTRGILREGGPEIAQGVDALGELAIRALNDGVRPFLVRWHSTSSEREAAGDELQGSERERFEAELAELRGDLAVYVEALGTIAGIRQRG